MDLTQPATNLKFAARSEDLASRCYPESFATIVERVLYPARKGNKAMYHACCTAFSKRCRRKSEEKQDPLHEHLQNTNVKEIFRLEGKLTVEEAWSQFVEWCERSNLSFDLHSAFKVNQKVCLKKLNDLQHKAAETELLRVYCLYTNPGLKDVMIKQSDQIEELQAKLSQKDMECKDHERRRAEKITVIKHQKMIIKKLEENLLTNCYQVTNKAMEVQDPLTSKLHATFQRLMKVCDKERLLRELTWLEEFVGEASERQTNKTYHDPSSQIHSLNLLGPPTSN